MGKTTGVKPSVLVPLSFSNSKYTTQQMNKISSTAINNPANIRLDEDVLKASRRRLLSSCSEGVFKTSCRRLDEDQ